MSEDFGIEAKWKRLRPVVLAADANPRIVTQLRDIFYLGAQSLMDDIMNIANDKSTRYDGFRSAMDRHLSELQDFHEEVQERQLNTN